MYCYCYSLTEKINSIVTVVTKRENPFDKEQGRQQSLSSYWNVKSTYSVTTAKKPRWNSRPFSWYIFILTHNFIEVIYFETLATEEG